MNTFTTTATTKTKDNSNLTHTSQTQPQPATATTSRPQAQTHNHNPKPRQISKQGSSRKISLKSYGEIICFGWIRGLPIPPWNARKQQTHLCLHIPVTEGRVWSVVWPSLEESIAFHFPRPYMRGPPPPPHEVANVFRQISSDYTVVLRGKLKSRIVHTD